MADRSYIIEILLKARDETARAFAEATGNLEAYDKLLDEQRVKTDSARAAQTRYAQEFQKGRSALQQQRDEATRLNHAHEETTRRLVAVEDAQRRVTRAQQDSSVSSAKYKSLIDQLVAAQNELKDALKENEGLNSRQARDYTNAASRRIAAEERVQASVKQTARDQQAAAAEAQRLAREREAADREYARASREINAEVARLQSDRMRQLDRQDRQESQQRIQRLRQEANIKRAQARADAEIQRTIQQEIRPAVRTLANPRATNEQEIAATARLTEAETRLSGVLRDQGKSWQIVRDAQQEALRERGFSSMADRDAVRVRLAVKEVDNYERALRRYRSSVAKGHSPIEPAKPAEDVMHLAEGGGRGRDPFSGWKQSLADLQGWFNRLDSSTTGFLSHIRGAFGFAAIGLIQPLIVLIVGLVGAFGSLASAAAAASVAMGVTFASAVAQGVPVMGLLGAAMQRLTSIMSYVQTVWAQQQQRFIAAYQTAQQNAMGINQITIAQHQYSDALFAARQAVRQVTIAELGLRSARQQATRQLQDLIFQETQARLAAEASSLAVVDSQKALQQAVATGGDVAQAQLQLQQARVGHAQAVVQAQRAISDAAPGSIARQQITEQVQQAQVAVEQSRRAVVDSQFSIAQARAAIIQARQAAAGYNVGTAAQLAYLRSQMTATERALTDNITKIYSLFQGVHGRLRPVTDAILAPFIGLSGRLLQIFRDPKFFGAFLNLGRSIGQAIQQVGRTLLSNQAINGFIALINAASRNMRPLATIASDFFRGMGAVVTVAIPFVHQFLGFLENIANRFASWAQSAQGKNWLKDFFDVAYKSLEAFINLGLSIGKLLAAVIGVGGGAQSGIGLIDSLTKKINEVTDSIDHHGKAFKVLHELWKSARPVLHDLAIILGALGSAFLSLTGSPQGQQGLNALAHLIANVLIPGLVRFAEEMGYLTVHVMEFLNQHPMLEKTLSLVIGTVATISLATRGIRLIFGPLAAGMGILRTFSEALGGIVGLIARLPGLGRLGGLAERLRGFGGGVASRIQNALTTGGKIAGKEIGARITEAGRTIGLGGHGGGSVIGEGLRGSVPERPVYVWVVNQGFGRAAAGERAPGDHPVAGEHPVGEHPTETPGVGGRARAAAAGARAVAQRTVDRITGPLRNATESLRGAVRGFGGRVAGRVGESAFGRILGGAGRTAARIPGLDLLMLGLGAATTRGGINQKAAGAVEFIDPTSWGYGLLPGPLGKFQGVAHSVFQPLLNRIGPGATAPRSEMTADDLRRRYGIPGNFSTFRLFHESPQQVIADWRRQQQNQALAPLDRAGTGPTSIFEQIRKPLTGALSGRQARSTGQQFAQSIHQGIRDGLHGVDTLLNRPITQMLVNGRRALGISSPSRRMEEIGVQIVQGLSQGVSGVRAVGKRIVDLILRGAQINWRDIRAIGSGIGLWVIDGINSVANVIGRDAQRSIFNPIRNRADEFQKSFVADWKVFWAQIATLTSDNIKTQEDDFRSLANNLKDIWTQINDDTKQEFETLLNNFKTTLTQIDQDIHDAFKYIKDATNSALKAFQATPVHITLGAIPQFASGGFIGNMGERGSDMVHAALGRGEAVLNYAHQAVVEPAMNAYYGFGLNKMFERVRGQHARPFAAGGYVYPFPAGTVVGRTDQGVDADPPAGQPIGPMGLARVTGIIQNWYKGQPFIWWKLLEGARRGAYAYVSEGIGKLAAIGSTLQANQAVAVSEPHGTGIEYGWATSSGQTLARVTGGYSEGQVTSAGSNMRAFLAGLAHGKLVGASLAAAGATAGAWNDLKGIAVHGPGPLHTVVHSAIEKVLKAANMFGSQQGGGGGGGHIGNMVGNIMQLAQAAAKHAGVAWVPNIVRALLGHESAGGVNEPPSGPLNATGPFQVIPSTFRAYMAPGHENIRNPWDNALAAFRYIKSRYHSLQELAAATGVMGGGYKGYAEGGVVGKPVPIIAHVGEWVLNHIQQSRIAQRLGTSVDGLRQFLGFGNPKQHFQSGGVVSDQPTVTRTGAFQTTNVVDLSIPGQLPAFEITEISKYNQATRFIIGRIERNRKKFTDGIQTFLSNFNEVGGDSGIFALAAQAIDNYVTQQGAVVQLSAAGVRIVNRVLTFGRAQTDLQAAQTDLAATERETTSFERLRGLTVRALRDTNRQIRDLLARSHGHLTGADLGTYRQLIGARNQFINDIQADTQKIAQSLSDQFQKAQAAFQAALDQATRRANLQQTFAQMAQSIAQTFGRTDLLASADRAVISASQEQVNALAKAYTSAAARAARDPRWQKIADDLAGQLASAESSLAQAQAQALQDAISAVDVRGQMQQTFVDLATRITNVTAALTGNQMAAITTQIGISQGNAAGLQGQLGQYQGLYAQAQAQGNVTAMNDLTQKIADLTSQVAEANLNTQQLITSLRETAITILQGEQSNTSSLIQAASGIVSTLGQISGSLNLPQQISILQQYGNDLVSQASNIVRAISGTMNDPNNPFGQFQTQANSILGPLIAAFQEGPQAFSSSIANLAPQIAALEAAMPPDVATLFQNLVQAMIDNTTATVGNNQQLQQLNATTNQQQFTSSAWTMFRNAIFNGLGGLLPQYAMTVPSMDVGGYLSSSGLLYGHKDELIVPANVTRSGEFGGTRHENHFHIDHPIEVADPVLFGSQVAWRINHNPNSR